MFAVTATCVSSRPLVPSTRPGCRSTPGAQPPTAHPFPRLPDGAFLRSVDLWRPVQRVKSPHQGNNALLRRSGRLAPSLD
jgi:hypothetical protein